MLNFLNNDQQDKKKHQSFFDTVAQFLVGNTSKLINQGYQEGKQVVDTGKMVAANVTHNPEAFAHANQQSQKDYGGFKGSGGLFNAGTATSEKTAKSGDLKSGAREIGGTTIGAATELLPFAKGIGVGARAGEAGTKGLSFGERAAQGLKQSIRTGAAYGGAGAAGQDLAENKNLSVEDMIKGALGGSILGTAGYGVGRGVGVAKKGAEVVGQATSIDHHPRLAGLLETKKTLTAARDNAPSVPAKKRLNKAIEAVNQEYRTERQKITEGGYAKIPGSSDQPGPQKAMDAITGNKPEPATPQIKPADRAAEALTGPSQKVGAAAVSGAQKPVSLTEALDAQLGKYNAKYKMPDNVKAVLDKSSAIGTPATKHDWAETFRDPTGVLGSHFGETGTTAAYKLQQGAKTVSDLEEAIRPHIQDATKQLNKLAKSDAGRADIQSRIYKALEDRQNVDQYLKTPKEKKLFNTVSDVFDFFKKQREATGKSTLENYSPRTEMKSALDAPDRMLNNVKQAFSPNTQSQFSKHRINDMPDKQINTKVVDLLPHYASSQAKEFGYTNAMDYIKKELPNVNPAYIANDHSRRRGEQYLQNMLTQVLQPSIPTKAERVQNKLIANTYKSQLGFSPKFAAQNLTQRYATKTQVSRKATKLVGKMDSADLKDLRSQITTGYNPILSEIDQSAESVGKVRGGLGKVGAADPGQIVEKGNVGGAFNRGAAQAILESDPYKAALKSGMKPKLAAKEALKDPAVRDLAIRRGNMVVNTTQFGGNFAAKPEFLRDQGSFLGLSKKWYQQYQRFPTGMIQLMGNVVKPNNARALDILRRGDPRQTPIVDYWKAAKSLQAGVDDVIKGAKKGEIQGVTVKDAKNYQNLLNEAVGNLEKQMKGASQIRSGKTTKNLLKMWAAASAIQFLFDGGSSSPTAQKKGTGAEISKSVQFGAPINIPTKNENPLLGARIPSSPFNPASGKVSGRKLLNFVPVVGPVVNRGRDAMKLINALTGDTGQ